MNFGPTRYTLLSMQFLQAKCEHFLKNPHGLPTSTGKQDQAWIVAVKLSVMDIHRLLRPTIWLSRH